jgi:hypothetical protein
VKKLVSIEDKTEIGASAETVFNILYDNLNYPRWSLGAEEIKEIGEGKFITKSQIGETTVIRKEAVPNKYLIFENEGSPFGELREDIAPKGDGVEVTVIGSLKDESMLEKVRKPTKIFLKSLKIYAEYIESGGNPDDYNKKEMLAIR